MRTHVSTPGRAHRAEGARDIHRALPEEVPVALVFNGTTQAVMMATPGDLGDFLRGFALTEAVVTDLAQISEIEIVEHPQGLEARAWLSEDRAHAMLARRRSATGPIGCGLCGIDSLEQAARPVPRVRSDLRLTARDVAGASDALRPHQTLHQLTGATHAAGFLVPGAGIAFAREDVGRHNALDKLIGALLHQGIDPASGAVVMTSRVSIELVQKCALAGIAILIAVSAPTAAALRLAEEAGITLAAFARNGAFDVFSHPHRIIDEAVHVA
ncbi:formate dehydrogenase accessory sulfurtransferase FdhD [Phaeobacter sp. HF9A]|uniref:formate dehydrogenase accessory sulfurtransferase FdhD n=1 Tax=Phaeobacter sp. HF9A TaxID=2721561 RepID=UPI00142FC2EF|nr:formate dehydrogenase accessory sulfurtransferase FdhD [Phaeobacter sp. HF9A]NIZ15133.1 formate dehydrogenase accessory sulfurtransferase FdhD [Phaeobacter sp. HF9A]